MAHFSTSEWLSIIIAFTIAADRATAEVLTRLRVTFTLTLEGANAFSGAAEARYYALDGTELYDHPHPAMLTGTRIQP